MAGLLFFMSLLVFLLLLLSVNTGAFGAFCLASEIAVVCVAVAFRSIVEYRYMIL